jgi:hypothetical protein
MNNSYYFRKNLAMQKIELFASLLQKHVPLQIKYKDESWEMRVLNSIVKWFNPRFMEDYTTVIGNTVYFTSREYVQAHPHDALQVLVHEAVHLLDTKRYSFPVFAFAYLFPQVLALGACLSPLSAYFLLFLLFLLPFPAPFRAYFEARAYATDLLLRRRSIENTLRFFTSWDYYKMYPFENQARKLLQHWKDRPDEIILEVIGLYEEVLKTNFLQKHI